MIRCFHHELLHMLDYKIMGGYAKADPKWEKLNPKDVTYGRGGKYNRDSNAFLQKVPNFVNAYAQCAVEEDKAETWSAMVVDPRSILEHEEKVIVKKGECIGLRIQKKICNKIDREFWERCQARCSERLRYEDSFRIQSSR